LRVGVGVGVRVRSRRFEDDLVFKTFLVGHDGLHVTRHPLLQEDRRGLSNNYNKLRQE